MQPLRAAPYPSSVLSSSSASDGCAPPRGADLRRGGRGTPLDNLLSIAVRIAVREGLFEEVGDVAA